MEMPTGVPIVLNQSQQREEVVVVAVEEDSPYASLNELMKEARDPYQLVYGTNLGAPNHYSALFPENGKSEQNFVSLKLEEVPSDLLN